MPTRHPNTKHPIDFDERPNIEHDDGTYSCPNPWCDQAGHRFQTYQSLIGHRGTCETKADGPFPCPVDGCDREFGAINGRSIHVTRCHVEEMGRERYPDGPPTHGPRSRGD